MSDQRQPQGEDEWREEMHRQGCDCACVRIFDDQRIIEAGGDPSDPTCIVFNHPNDCHYSRTWMAPYN